MINQQRADHIVAYNYDDCIFSIIFIYLLVELSHGWVKSSQHLLVIQPAQWVINDRKTVSISSSRFTVKLVTMEEGNHCWYFALLSYSSSNITGSKCDYKDCHKLSVVHQYDTGDGSPSGIDNFSVIYSDSNLTCYSTFFSANGMS